MLTALAYRSFSALCGRPIILLAILIALIKQALSLIECQTTVTDFCVPYAHFYAMKILQAFTKHSEPLPLV